MWPLGISYPVPSGANRTACGRLDVLLDVRSVTTRPHGTLLLWRGGSWSSGYDDPPSQTMVHTEDATRRSPGGKKRTAVLRSRFAVFRVGEDGAWPCGITVGR